MPAASAGEMSTVISIENVSKSFGKHPALKSVSLEIGAGEIHGLIGENGSGKSTLLNILCGHPVIRETGGYSGAVQMDGKNVRIPSPRVAIESGIGMVHQEFVLLPDFTVAQNIALGRENLVPVTHRILPRGLALIDTANDRKRAVAALKELKTEVDAAAYPADLPINLNQYVEIARETCRHDLKVLILDEPTATLGKKEAESLLDFFRCLARQGMAIIFVSHRLEEITSICDRITVFRDGEVAARFDRRKEKYHTGSIIHAMLGRTIQVPSSRKTTDRNQIIMEFRNWKVEMPGETITGLDLGVKEGEIIGITGLPGHGKTAIGYGLAGMFATSGSVSVAGRELDPSNPSSAVANNVFLLPDDRRNAGLMLERSITENIIFHANQHKNKFLSRGLGRFGLIDWTSARRHAEECVQAYDIRCNSVNQPAGSLSGGNQQKVCLARMISLEASVLVVSEPTRGIDIGAKQIILQALLEANRKTGTSIICISSELGDLKQICDRIAVVHEGSVRCELSPEADDAEFIVAFTEEESSVQD